MWSFQFSSVAQLCPTLCDPMNCSTQDLPVHHQLPESTQTHVHRVSDAIQPSHPLLSPSPPALNLSQHQGLFQWVSSSHQVAKVLEFQLQHQSFQWPWTCMWWRWLLSLNPVNPPLLGSNSSLAAFIPFSTSIDWKEVGTCSGLGFDLRNCCYWFDFLSRPLRYSPHQ